MEAVWLGFGTLRGVMTSYPFLKMVAGSHIEFDLNGHIRPPTKCSCWSKVGPPI